MLAFARIQRRLGVATIYVTHDQTEAMTMGDRVAVMRDGILQQVDAPQVLYDRPANVFVAAFIGSPAMNLYEGVVSPDGSQVRLGDQALDLPRGAAGLERHGQDVIVGIRPENLADAVTGGAAGARGSRLEGEVDIVEALGSEKLVHFRIEAPRVHTVDAVSVGDGGAEADALSQGELGTSAMNESVARVEPTSRIRAGERAAFRVDAEHLHLFDPATSLALWPAPQAPVTAAV